MNIFLHKAGEIVDSCLKDFDPALGIEIHKDHLKTRIAMALLYEYGRGVDDATAKSIEIINNFPQSIATAEALPIEDEDES